MDSASSTNFYHHREDYHALADIFRNLGNLVLQTYVYLLIYKQTLGEDRGFSEREYGVIVLGPGLGLPCISSIDIPTTHTGLKAFSIP